MTRSHIVVRFCETDLMGIVHHANYLHYFEIGRVDWLKARGVSYESWVARGVHLPVVDVKIRYRKAARFDDTLALETRVADVSRVTVRFVYRILRELPSLGSPDVLCEGETLLACVGEKLTARRFPPDVEAILRGQPLPAAD